MTIDHYSLYVGARRDSNVAQQAPSSNFRGDVVTITDRFEIANAGDVPVPVPEENGIPEHDPVVHLFNIPSHAVIKADISRLLTTALGDGVVVDIGVADDDRHKIAGQQSVFREGLDVSAASTVPFFSGINAANVGAQLWQLIGLEDDPRTDLCVIMTIKGAAPAPGAIAWEILATE